MDYKTDPNKFDEETKSILVEFYSKLLDIYNKIGYDKNTIKFIDSLSDTLPKLFYKYNMIEAIEFLILFDGDNENKYIKYIERKKLLHITF